MAYRDFLVAPTDTVPVPESSVVESERFGLKTSRVHVGPRTSCSVSELAQAIRADDADLVILRYPADRLDWYATLVRETGYRVIFSESLLLQTVDLPGPVAEREPEGRITFRSLGDEAATAQGAQAWRVVDDIVAGAFAGHRPHYRSNPYIPVVPLADIYGEWLRSMAETPEGRVLLWCLDGEPAGVIGFDWFEVADGQRQAEIKFWAPNRALTKRRRRYFEAARAITESHDLLEGDGVGRSASVIQTHNLWPIRTMLRMGYKPELVVITLHLVHPRVDRPLESAL